MTIPGVFAPPGVLGPPGMPMPYQQQAAPQPSYLPPPNDPTLDRQDGARAIEVAREFRPQAMLLDLGMPGTSGYDVCRSIRQFDWGMNVCIVALTGWGQDGDRRKTRIAGFDHHLVKPGTPEEITRILSSLSR